MCDPSLLQDNMTLEASEPRSFAHFQEQEVDISLLSLVRKSGNKEKEKKKVEEEYHKGPDKRQQGE